jgi:hypothetical protein
MADKTMTKEREKYNESIERLFGDLFKYKDFSNIPELESLGTPSFESYKDDEGGQIPAPRDDDDEANPDTYDQYVGAEVVLPKRERYHECQGPRTETPNRRDTFTRQS